MEAIDRIRTRIMEHQQTHGFETLFDLIEEDLEDIVIMNKAKDEAIKSQQETLKNIEESKTEHQLKTWKSYFVSILQNEKTFEVRRNDRDFKVGDILVLQEYDHNTNYYTGRYLKKRVKYVLEGGNFGIESGYVVMGI